MSDEKKEKTAALAHLEIGGLREQFALTERAEVASPYNQSKWYGAEEEITHIHERAVPHLIAQGWRVVAGGYYANPVSWDVDTGFTVYEYYWIYNLKRRTLRNAEVTQDLLRLFTKAYNEGREDNNTRYENVVELWTQMSDQTQAHLEAVHDEVDAELSIHLTSLEDLEAEYDTFFEGVKAELNKLEVTLQADRERVESVFASLASDSKQELERRGFYLASLQASVESGIDERKALALLEINEREQRLMPELVLRKNEIFVEVLKMRMGLIQTAMGITDRKQKLLAYMLDTRNNVLLGLFGFVEKRQEQYPQLESFGQIVTAFGTPGQTAWRSG
jgi:hypothetical protein